MSFSYIFKFDFSVKNSQFHTSVTSYLGRRPSPPWKRPSGRRRRPVPLINPRSPPSETMAVAGTLIPRKRSQIKLSSPADLWVLNRTRPGINIGGERRRVINQPPQRLECSMPAELVCQVPRRGGTGALWERRCVGRAEVSLKEGVGGSNYGRTWDCWADCNPTLFWWVMSRRSSGLRGPTEVHCCWLAETTTQNSKRISDSKVSLKSVLNVTSIQIFQVQYSFSFLANITFNI